jgi:opacity protein-like surface antigen
MKRFLVLLLAATSISTIAKSQQYEYDDTKGGHSGGGGGGNLRFGVFIAPTVSWMKPTANKSDDKLYLISSQGSKIGYTWGLMMDYPFAENYGIATGFQIVTEGGKILAEENTNTTQPATINRVTKADFDYTLKYLEIPFGLKLRSDELGGGLHVFGQMGLSLGINIGKKASYDVSYTDTSDGKVIVRSVSENGEKIFGSSAIAPVLLSLNLGAGLEYSLSEKMSLYLGLFFNNGFVPDVTNPNRLDLNYKGKFSDSNTRMNSIALRLGLFF